MNFMEFLHVHGNPQRIKTQRGNQKEAYLLEERQICEELTRQRAWARVSKQSEVPLQTRGSRTRLCSASCGAVSELMRVYLQQKGQILPTSRQERESSSCIYLCLITFSSK